MVQVLLVSSSFSNYIWVYSNFFDVDVMSGGHDGVCVEDNEEFVLLVTFGRGVSCVI